MLERALMFCGGDQISQELISLRGRNRPAATLTARATLEEIDRSHIESVMRDVAGKVDEAARILAIPRSSLYAKLKR